MRFLIESHRCIRRFGLAFLGLALAVFAWGLQYKLSLYDPPQAASHQMPHAKLLSKDRQSPAAGHLVIAREETTSIGAVVAGCSFVFFLLLLNDRAALSLFAQQRLHGIRRPWIARSFADLTAFFFRPPPVFS